MNTRLNEIINDIKDARSTVLDIMRGLPQEELDEQPGPGKWSIGEIVHHLYLVETGIIKLLEKQIQRAKKRGIGPDTNDESLLGSLDRFALETAETKFSAPGQTAPRHGVEKKELVELLHGSRSELMGILLEASSFDLSELLFPHPALGRLNMYQWVLFVGKHDRRHTAQLKAIMKDGRA